MPSPPPPPRRNPTSPPVPPTAAAALEAPPGFVDAARALGIEFDPGDVEQLGRFLALMLETNKSFNLTSITDPEEAWSKHILDALALVPLLAELPSAAGGAARVMDVGSGGGVPAVPLAIVIPAARFTLLEPTGKKAAFLTLAAQTLGLANVTVIQDRAEKLGQDYKGLVRGDGLGAHREGYDAVTVRAVGHLAIIAELCLPLVKMGGLVLAVKGAKADQELEEASKAIGMLGGRHAGTVETPTGRVIVLEKASRTPRVYPRRDGEPKRAPLGYSPPST